MEMGPGRGTLMDDVLRSIRNFPPLAKAIEAIYLVEASPQLREAQHKLLCGENALESTAIGHRSTSKYSEDLEIHWTENLRSIPRQGDKTPFILAHEFFDALPIHVFQSVPPSPQSAQSDSTIETPTGPIARPRRLPQASQQHQWRELMVSPKPPHRLKSGEPEFEMSFAKAATPHSMYLPEISPRYQALRDTTDATIEVSPESQAIVQDFAERLGGSNSETTPKNAQAETPGRQAVSQAHQVDPVRKLEPSGAALIIDYGPASTIPANSLRGIRAHERVSPFESPGATDVSADVDFLALAETALNASPGVEVHGPVDQARFLTGMGIEERVAQLVKQAVDKARAGSAGHDKGELTEVVKRVESGWKRLVDRSPQGMGRLYQVMAIVPYAPVKEGDARRRPVGFGGDVRV